MSPVNTLISLFSPTTALHREAASAASDAIRASADATRDPSETRHRGASRMLTSLRNWVPGLGGPRTDLPTGERKTLTARSRDAYRNHMIARAVVERCRLHTVGTGLRLNAQIDAAALGLDDDTAKALNAQIEREWRLYIEDPRECDAESTLNGYQLQDLALVSSMISGDVFGLTPMQRRTGCVYGLKMQLIEADRVGSPMPYGMDSETDDGIRVDALGAPIAVYVYDQHPGESRLLHRGYVPPSGRWLAVWGRVTGRRRVFHLMDDKTRPGQRRGAPFLAPLLEPLQQLETYSRAELTAAVVSSLLTVFIKNESTQSALPGINQADPNDTGIDEDSEIELGSGSVIELGTGQSVEQMNPARPNAQFDPFFTAVCKQIGAATSIPFEEVLLSYQASYSAARAAMLQAHRLYLSRRARVESMYVRPWFELWFDEMVSRGRIDVAGYADPARRRAYTRAQWIGPARGAVDELKEANAAEKRIQIGVSTIAREAQAMTGEDFDAVHQQRTKEQAMRREAGLLAEPAAATEPAAPAEVNE